MNDRIKYRMQGMSGSFNDPPPEYNGSKSSRRSNMGRRASEYIINVPVTQLKKIGATKEINSLYRETQHFVGITTIHGALRIYRAHGVSRWLWTAATIGAIGFFCWQLIVLCLMYSRKPTASQVSFLLPENGLQFPDITICNYNPIRASVVESLNASSNGSFTQQVLDYMIISYLKLPLIISMSPEDLADGEHAYKQYLETTKSTMSIEDFYIEAGPVCNETLLLCTFGSREFDCCKYVTNTLTDMGLCFRMSLSQADEPFLRAQIQAGVGNGLQIIADNHKEEQVVFSFDPALETHDAAGNREKASEHRYLSHMLRNLDVSPGIDGILSQAFETGFLFYPHAGEEVPFLSAEAINVSPGARIYSAISPNKFILLSEESWGNCSNTWPKGYEHNAKYSSMNCNAMCNSKFYYDLCGCSPFIYNTDQTYPVCTAYEVYDCIAKDQGAVVNDQLRLNTTLQVPVPKCTECKMECERWAYHTYNSYGEGFSKAATTWLVKRFPFLDPAHIKANLCTMNIYFRDMAYTQYQQVQSTSLAQLLSNIGGNMGMSLGMSLISIAELFVYIWKTFWLFISKKRQNHLIQKRKQEKERDAKLQQTLDAISEAESPPPITLRRLARSLRRKVTQVFPRSNPAQDAEAHHRDSSASSSTTDEPPVDRYLEAKLHGLGRADAAAVGNNDPRFVQVTIHPHMLRQMMQTQKEGGRRRSSSCSMTETGSQPRLLRVPVPGTLPITPPRDPEQQSKTRFY